MFFIAWFSVLSNISGEDPQAKKLIWRLGVESGLINLSPWVSDLPHPVLQGWSVLGHLSKASKHSTDRVSARIWLQTHTSSLQVPLILLFSPSHVARQCQEAFLPVAPQLPSFLLTMLLWLWLSYSPPCAKAAPFRTSGNSGLCPSLPYSGYFDDQSVDPTFKQAKPRRGRPGWWLQEQASWSCAQFQRQEAFCLP